MRWLVNFFRTKILKQKAIPWIGGFKDIFTMVVFYMSMINFALICITAYNTGLRDWLLQHGLPWVKVWMFLGLMGLIALVGMIFEYKFIYPSFFEFRSKQEYKHKSPIAKDLGKALAKLDDVLKRQGKLEKKLKEISGEKGGKNAKSKPSGK